MSWLLHALHVMVAGLMPAHQAASPLHAEVFHSWTSGSEAAAIQVVEQGYVARGGSWHSDAIAGFENASAVALNRILGGDPPTAMAYVPGPGLDDLIDQGILTDLDGIAAQTNLRNRMPEALRASLSRNGHLWGVPLSVSGESWIFWSKPVFAKLGIDGPPATLDAFFADLDIMKRAGIVPLAWGGQPWQEVKVFSTILLNRLGLQGYRRFYARDPEIMASPQLREAVVLFARLRDYVDPGSPNRNWNDSTALVIANRAGMQIMGDWAKGEFRNAGKLLGRDYGCALFPGLDATEVVADALVFPLHESDGNRPARELLVRTIIDPATQLRYSAVKGSVPALRDIDTSTLDSCSQQTFSMMRRNRIALDIGMTLDPETSGALTDLVGQYWSDRTMGADLMMERIGKIMQRGSHS